MIQNELRPRILLAAIICLLLPWLPRVAFAQSDDTSPARAGSELTIKLVTVEPGDAIYLWWGHAGIIVENRRTQSSRFYDFGLFSFRQERFYSNFTQGRLLFEVGVWRTEAYLEHYRNMNRSVRIQTLEIEPSRRVELARALERNASPENRVYLYDHYYDNCATRLRDYVDEYTDGAVQRATNYGAGITFREITRKYNTFSPFRIGSSPFRLLSRCHS